MTININNLNLHIFVGIAYSKIAFAQLNTNYLLETYSTMLVLKHWMLQ